MTLFNYTDKDAIGAVYSVDTGTVIVSVSDEEHLRTLQVNHLVVLRSARAGQHLIGLINKITRRSINDPLEEDSGEDLSVENVIRITLIGTMIDMVGQTPNVFRRTLETVPENRCQVLHPGR